MIKHLRKAAYVAFLAVLASTSCVKKASEDEKVIETVFATIDAEYSKAGHPLKINEVILVEPKWSSPKRASFADGVKDLEEEAVRTKNRSYIAEIRSAQHRTNSWSPPAPGSLTSMALGSKVVVGTLVGSWSRSDGHRIKGASPWLTAMADYELEPPSYSPDGNYAVLKGSFPWSIHFGTFRYYLKKGEQGWSAIRKVETYYL